MSNPSNTSFAETAQSAAQTVATDAGTSVATAAQAATSVLKSGGDLPAAFSAFEDALVGIVETMIGSQAGPLAGAVSTQVLPEAVSALNAAIPRWIGGLYKHIGAEFPADLAAVLAKL
jgi:hypothetical protein